MLVLNRKQSETITIGDHIVVKVVQAGRGAVKIGIDAPDGLRVLRGELTPRQIAAPQRERPPESSLAAMAARARESLRTRTSESAQVGAL